MMVRQAVLKGKDPMKLLEEMEAIDRMGLYLDCCFYIYISKKNKTVKMPTLWASYLCQ